MSTPLVVHIDIGRYREIARQVSVAHPEPDAEVEVVKGSTIIKRQTPIPPKGGSLVDYHLLCGDSAPCFDCGDVVHESVRAKTIAELEAVIEQMEGELPS